MKSKSYKSLFSLFFTFSLRIFVSMSMDLLLLLLLLTSTSILFSLPHHLRFSVFLENIRYFAPVPVMLVRVVPSENGDFIGLMECEWWEIVSNKTCLPLLFPIDRPVVRSNTRTHYYYYYLWWNRTGRSQFKWATETDISVKFQCEIIFTSQK